MKNTLEQPQPVQTRPITDHFFKGGAISVEIPRDFAALRPDATISRAKVQFRNVDHEPVFQKPVDSQTLQGIRPSYAKRADRLSLWLFVTAVILFAGIAIFLTMGPGSRYSLNKKLLGKQELQVASPSAGGTESDDLEVSLRDQNRLMEENLIQAKAEQQEAQAR